MQKLSDHFTLEEMTFSQTATNFRISNEPSKEVLDRLHETARKMEVVRALCGNRPIFVTSGYRSLKVNGLVGGSPTSAHTKGFAVDFKVAGLSVSEVCDLLHDKITYDQLINEFGRWTHISFDPRSRKQYFSL